MTAQGVELATGYVSLTVSAKGIGRDIGRQVGAEVGPPLEQAGQRAGQAAAESAASGFKDKFKSAGAGIAKVGARLSAGITAPLAIIGKQTIDAASNLNESMSKASVVFGENVGTINALAADSAKKLGQSRQQVFEAAGTFGNLFTALGVGQKPAADMSAKLVTLASDLASFNNLDPGDVLEKLRAGLTGEGEPLKALGVDLNETTLKAQAMADGISDGTKPLTGAQKAQAAYALILRQTTTAQGDFARTSDGLANKQRIATAAMDDAKAKIGQALLPIMVKVATIVGDVAARFTNLSPTMQKVILVVAGVAAAAGPVVTVIGGVTAALGLLLSPVGLVIAGLALLVGGLVLAYQHSETFRDIVRSVGSFLAGEVLPRIQAVVSFVTDRLIPGLLDVARAIGEKLKPHLDDLRQAFIDNKPEIDAVTQFIGKLIDKGAELQAKFIEDMLPVLKKVGGFLGGQFIDYITGVVKGFGELVDIIKKVLDVAGKIKDIGGGVGEKILGAIPGFASGGYAPPGTAYLSGEDGVELNVAGRLGTTIVPAGPTQAILEGSGRSASPGIGRGPITINANGLTATEASTVVGARLGWELTGRGDR